MFAYLVSESPDGGYPAFDVDFRIGSEDQCVSGIAFHIKRVLESSGPHVLSDAVDIVQVDGQMWPSAGRQGNRLT
jgi:hypothetical protein